MNDPSSLNILIAEDNDVTRDMMTAVLEGHGYNIIHAADGNEAIAAAKDFNLDIALVDINMTPLGGFEFVRYLVSQGIKMPVAIITGDESSDILVEASALHVAQVIQKPVSPDQLLAIVERMLRRVHAPASTLGDVETRKSQFSHEELMHKAIDVAAQNVRHGHGGPYGAVIATKDGEVLGSGANGRQSRIDPIAHAEVMAIRQASEKLGQTSLSNCVLYCSSEPTKIGKALIESVGIKDVYFGLSHKDIAKIGQPSKPVEPKYSQLCKDDALAMFKATKA